METPKKVNFPKWAIVTYLVMAISLVPWIFNLANNLPTRHLVGHWDAVWVGFDVLMLTVLAMTLYFAYKRLIWAALTGSILATLFIVDSWFDIMTSQPGREQRISIIFGFLEVSLALVTYKFIYHFFKESSREKIIFISSGKNK